MTAPRTLVILARYNISTTPKKIAQRGAQSLRKSDRRPPEPKDTRTMALINKTDAFLTVQERGDLFRLEDIKEQVYSDYQLTMDIFIEAKETGEDNEKALDRLSELEKRFMESSEKIDAIREKATGRYIEHFHQNPQELLADIKDIVDHIELEDFKFYLETHLDIIKALRHHAEETGNTETLADLQSKQLRYYSENTSSMYSYLSGRVDTQLRALESWGYLSNTKEGQEALRIIKDRAIEFYPEEPEEIAEQLSIFLAPEQGIIEELTPRKKLYSIPTSPATNLITEVLGAGKRLAELPSRKSEVNHNIKYDLKTSGKKKLVTMESTSASVAVEITDLEKLRKPAKKLLQLSLIKANEQALHKGILTRDYINISIAELLELGLYTTPQSARTGLKTGAEALYSISINGYLKRGKSKKKVEQEVKERLFTGIHRNGRGDYRLFLNNRINWGLLASYYTSLPSYYFKLPDKASDLLFYIFYLARQNTSLLAEQGYFTISFRAIQERLFLPSEKKTKDPQRDIKDIIERAVTEIEDSHRAEYNNTELQLELIGEDKPIASYLDKGYLKVYLSGSFAEPFLERNIKKAKKISSAQKKQEQVVKEAKVRALTKKLEQEPEEPTEE